MKEIWEDIGIVKGIDFTGYYQISNMGRVKSLERFVKAKSGFRKKKTKILKQSNTSIYFTVELNKDTVTKRCLIHRLVLLAFVPNLENKPMGNHKDGNKQNNYVSNLEWATAQENTIHAHKLGLSNMERFKRKVVMLSLDNEPLLVFDSITEASQAINGSKTNHISGCCQRKKSFNTAYGYKWKYKDEIALN